MPSLRFDATIEIHPPNPYVFVSAARAKALKDNWRRPMPVLVKINGRPDPPWRINIVPSGEGNFFLYLHGSLRKASRTKVGDQVEVEMEFDTEYRNGPLHPMPSWFRERLNRSAKARQAWQSLPPSRQKEILRYFAQLKTEDARARNLKRALYVLSGNEGRFMARSWKDGK